VTSNANSISRPESSHSSQTTPCGNLMPGQPDISRTLCQYFFIWLLLEACIVRYWKKTVLSSLQCICMFQLFSCVITVFEKEIETLSRFIAPPVMWLLLYLYGNVTFFCSFHIFTRFKIQISGVLQIFCLNIAFTRKFRLKRAECSAE